MAAKKQDAVDTKKRKRLNTETRSNSKPSKFVASKKHKPDSVPKEKKVPLTGRERRLQAKVSLLY